jgi:hypothetical protein
MFFLEWKQASLVATLGATAIQVLESQVRHSQVKIELVNIE